VSAGLRDGEGRPSPPRYGCRVPTTVEIAPLASSAELAQLLPLIADYQRFYEVERIDEERNRAFFARFLSPSDDGMILAARDSGASGFPLGYACLYWHLSSLAAAETVLMNDLFVAESARGRGTGRALIEASAAVARERGAHSLEWATAPDNERAQALYDSTGASRDSWLSYELLL
jgi:GNAT superfamily N-acetyltransferase